MELSWNEKHCKIILDQGEEILIQSKNDPRCPPIRVWIDEFDDINHCMREKLPPAPKKNKKVK